MTLDIVVLGLSITSSWGNGHATTYRALLRDLARRGHGITFLERDLPFYAANRDLPSPGYARTHLYDSLEELDARFADAVRRADLVIIGSYVPDGDRVGDWALALAPGRVAFYDIDTPVTLSRLDRGEPTYLRRDQIPRYSLYLSFTGGPTLSRIERSFGSPCARALYCSVDPELYFQEERPAKWEIGYLGTYSQDRQATLERLLCEPAKRDGGRRYVVAGAQYPDTTPWPTNVDRIPHLPPDAHRTFFNRQRFSLNVTRAPMVAAGYSPSVRLFEAAACGTPVISDEWAGLETVFVPEREILVARTAHDVERITRTLSEADRIAIGHAARSRVLAEHTSMHRAETLERHARELLDRQARRRPAAKSLQPVEG